MDIQLTMEFILEQQAANTSDIGALKESTRALQQNAMQLHESVRSLATTAGHMLDVQQSHENIPTALADSHLKLAHSHLKLADSHRKLTDSQQKLNDSQQKLTDSQTETEDKLHALIDIVDRLFPKQ